MRPEWTIGLWEGVMNILPRQETSLSFLVPRGQEDCLLWPFLNGTPKPHRLPNMLTDTLHIWTTHLKTKPHSLISMQLRFLLRLFSCYWKSPQIPGSFWNINIYTIMSKQLSSTKAWILEQPVFIANKKQLDLLKPKGSHFFPLKNREFDLTLEELGWGQATLCHLPGSCLSLPILTSFLLYISNPLHPGLLCATKVRKVLLSCLTSIQNYVKMHLPVSDAHLWSNQLTLELIIQHGHGMHGRS